VPASERESKALAIASAYCAIRETLESNVSTIRLANYLFAKQPKLNEKVRRNELNAIHKCHMAPSEPIPVSLGATPRNSGECNLRRVRKKVVDVLGDGLPEQVLLLQGRAPLHFQADRLHWCTSSD
jgi:hypothetical protein